MTDLAFQLVDVPPRATVTWTGHRPQKLGGYDEPNTYRTVLKQHIGQVLDIVRPLGGICGMALGLDQWVAEVLVERGLPWVAAVPCRGQEKMWPTASQERYRWLLSKASKVVYVTDGPYTPYVMHRRNHWMVDRSQVLFSYWDGSKGGTAGCTQYAREQQPAGEGVQPASADDGAHGEASGMMQHTIKAPGWATAALCSYVALLGCCLAGTAYILARFAHLILPGVVKSLL